MHVQINDHGQLGKLLEREYNFMIGAVQRGWHFKHSWNLIVQCEKDLVRWSG
jgi:hypothetical protein